MREQPGMPNLPSRACAAEPWGKAHCVPMFSCSATPCRAATDPRVARRRRFGGEALAAGRRPGRAALLLAGLFCLAGCPTAPPPVPPPAPPPPPPALDVAAVNALLERGRQAFKEDRLTLPAQGSAAQLYRQALQLDPGNKAALRGLEQIVERYVKLALDALNRQQFQRARSLLERARQVDAAHPAIAPTEHQARLLETAERRRLRLDAAGLAARSQEVAGALQALGAQAKQSSCLAIIRASSDAQGRWIYAQLNRGAGTHRVRAQLEVAAPASVELVCFDPSLVEERP